MLDERFQRPAAVARGILDLSTDLGRSPAGWQFTQRGWVSTLPSSANSAADRAAVSPIAAKLSGLASVSDGPSDTA
jgi:hypothetical protein